MNSSTCGELCVYAIIWVIVKPSNRLACLPISIFYIRTFCSEFHFKCDVKFSFGKIWNTVVQCGIFWFISSLVFKLENMIAFDVVQTHAFLKLLISVCWNLKADSNKAVNWNFLIHNGKLNGLILKLVSAQPSSFEEFMRYSIQGMNIPLVII